MGLNGWFREKDSWLNQPFPDPPKTYLIAQAVGGWFYCIEVVIVARQKSKCYTLG